MTIQDIIGGIVNGIYAQFGATHKIYTEKVEQGLAVPAFFVKCLDPSFGRQLGERYGRTTQFSIQFFPSVDGSYSELRNAYEKLEKVLLEITVGSNILHGKNIFGQFTDGILTMTATFDCTFIGVTTPAETKMGTITVTSEVEIEGGD